MMNSGIYNQVNPSIAGTMPMDQTGLAQMPMPTEVKANQMVQNQINPKAFSNAAAIQGVYGTTNPGTFTKTVGPQVPPVDPASITPTPNFNNI